MRSGRPVPVVSICGRVLPRVRRARHAERSIPALEWTVRTVPYFSALVSGVVDVVQFAKQGQIMIRQSLLSSAVWCLLTAFSGVADAQEPTVDFARDVQPILSKNCTACHNAKKSEGGLNLDSFAAMMKGGDGGPAVVADDIEASQIIERVIANDDSIMPPIDNVVGAERLSAAQVDVLKDWILSGALDSTSAVGPLAWNERVSAMRPIYRVEAGTDGVTMVFGSGSHVAVVGPELGGDQLVELVDPKLEGEQRAHEDFVQSIAISNDNQWIATGGYRTVKLWKRAYPSKTTLSGLLGVGTLAAFSDDGKRLAYSNERQRLVIVDIETGRVVELLKGHTQPLTSIAWIGSAVLSADEAGVIFVTDGADFTSRRAKSDGVPIVHQWQRWDSGRLCGTTADGLLVVVHYQVVDGVTTLVAHPKELPSRAAGVSTSTDPARPQLAVALEDGQVWVWSDSLDAEPKKVSTGAPVLTLAISPLGDRVITTAGEQPPKLWSTADGKLVAELRRDVLQTLQLEFAQADVTRQQGRVDRLKAELPKAQEASKKEEAAKAKVAETQKKAAEALAAVVKELEAATSAVTTAENEVKQAEAAIAEAMKRMEAAQKAVEDKKKAMAAVVIKRDKAANDLAKRDQALATSTDSAKRAATAIPALEVKIKAETDQLAVLGAKLKAAEGAALPAGASKVEFDLVGRQAVVTSSDGVLRRFASNTGLPLAADPGAGKLQAMSPLPSGEVAIVTDQGACFERSLASTWRLARQIGSAKDSPFAHRVTALDFASDNKTLAVGGGQPSRSGEIHLVDSATGAVLRHIDATHSDTVVDLAISPSQRFIASAGSDNLGRVFDLDSGQEVQSLEGHGHHVLGISWRNDEQVLATAGADRTVKVWSFATGTANRTIGGFPNEVTDIGFLGATSEVLTSVADGSVRRHNADSGKQVRVYGGASGALFGLGIGSKTDIVVAGGQAGTVWAWRLDSGEQLARYPPAP